MKSFRRATRLGDLLVAGSGAIGTALPAGFSVAEGPPVPGPAPLDERLVQAIWNEQLLKSDVLVTLDKRPVRVFDPGQWNGEAGPDFKNADIAIGGQRFRGDVEIHVNASEWEKHGHHRDFDYNGVVLHVVLYRDDDRVADELHNGAVAPRLALEDFLEPDLDTIRQTLSGEDFFLAARSAEQGPGCHLEVARVADGRLCELMEEAGRERLEVRVERYGHQAASTSMDQAFYQALMASLGHKGSKTLYFLLARRAPLDDLRLVLRHTPPAERSLAIEVILLHVSGLVAAEPAECDGETRAYLERLQGAWRQYERFFLDRLIPPTRRWMTGTRPVNFPMRRIAGMARFLAYTGFEEGLTAAVAALVRGGAARSPRAAKDFQREIKALTAAFEAQDCSYWSNHYTLGGKPAAKPMALIGEDRALSMVFNAVLPMMLLYARHMGDDVLEKFVWRLHGNFPALQANSITKFMRERLFGAGPARPGLNFRLEHQNQALIHIYQECCSNGDLTCEQCVFRRLG